MSLGMQSSSAQSVGNYSSHILSGNNIVIKCTSGATVKIELCKADIARIRMALPGEAFITNEQYSVVKYDWPKVQAMVSDAGKYIKIATPAMVIRVYKIPFSLAFYEKDNKTLITRQDDANCMGWHGQNKTMHFEMDPGGKQEHIYGCGAHWKFFDLRRLNMKIWQKNPNETKWALDGTAETVVPYYWSSAGYGMLLHNSYQSSFDFGKANPSSIEWNVTNGELDFYFLKGPSFKKILRNYCELTGYLQMPREKSLGLTYRAQGNNGYLIPKEVYLSAADLDGITDEFRSRGVPCDVIATEPGWAVGYGNTVWESSRFPDPKAWCDRMISKGFAPNLWMRNEINDREISTLLEPYRTGSMLDVTMSKGMDAYFGWLKTHIFDLGVLGFKEDTHGLPESDAKMKSGLSLKEYHNNYSFLWADALFKRYKQAYNKRFFLFCTALWTGAQRYPVVGYSDQGVQIPWISNSGWTGMAYTPELQNWSGENSYKDLHSVALTPYMVQNEWIYGKLPWGSDQKSFDVYQRYLKLHYRLIPYIYSHMWEQHNTGVGPIRPLPMEYQDDENTFAIADQYFYGKNLMVSFNHSKIYLPKGKWTYYWSGKIYEGGTTLTNFNAPAEELPLFVREGAIIPMMPDMNYVGEKLLDPLIMDIYPTGSSTFTLFEDDGVTFDYEKGDYCETGYKVDNKNGSVTIIIYPRKTPGKYLPHSRNYLFTVHTGIEPARVSRDGKSLIKVNSEAVLKSSPEGWRYENGITYIRFADTGMGIKIRVQR